MKRFLAVFIAGIMAFSMEAYADVTEYTKKNNAGTIAISGTVDSMDEDSIVGIRIIKKTSDYVTDKNTKIEDSDVLFLNEFDLKAGETSFLYEFYFDGTTDDYYATIGNENFSMSKDFKIRLVNVDDYVESAGKANNDFSSLTEYDKFVLEFDYKANDDSDTELALQLIEDSISAKQLELEENVSDAETRYKKAILAADIKSGKFKYAADYIDCINCYPEKISNWFKEFEKNSKVVKRLVELLQASPYTTINSNDEFDNKIDKFERALKEAILLTGVNYPGVSTNVGTLMTDFKEITGLSSVKTAGIKAVSGKEFDSIEDLLKVYNDAVKDGGSSGGGVSPSGGGYVKNDDVSIYVPDQQVDNTKTDIGLKFIDLDTVGWAYESISTLFDRGIISGKSETLFAPKDNITREEFAKILIVAMNMQNSEYTNNFADSSSSDWYNPYINIANEIGVCNGMGNGKFGVGTKITREDMAVMIARAIEFKKHTLTGSRPTFSDSDDISDYAKDAVGILSSNGIISGAGNNMFLPKNNATRAEAAKMIFNVLDMLE